MIIALVAVSLFAAALLVVIARMAWLMLIAHMASLEEKNAALMERIKELEDNQKTGKRWTHRETLDIENAQAVISTLNRELSVLISWAGTAAEHLGKLRGSRNGGDDD